MELSRGTWIGPYRIDALIARGGMGAVYRAARSDGAPVALKILHASAERPEQLARFEREAQLAARLSHPGIVRIHAAGAVQGAHYIAMDLVEGEPLSERCGRLAPLQAARLVAQVARAIEHAHAHGVLHRDIKPSNVLVRGDEALITDFGVARSLLEGSALTRTGALVGTPTHMAPEQVTGQPVSEATDVHGLGVLLYEALAGTPPFQKDSLSGVMVAVTSEVPAPPSRLCAGVPPALDRLVLAALDKVPARRPSAGAFAAALEDLAVGRTPGAAPWRARALAAVAVVMVGVGAGVGVSLRSRAEEPPAPPPERASVATPSTSLVAVQAAEPAWLRALDDGGELAQLRLARVELQGDALRAVEATTRARAAHVLERLDASWTDPRGSDPVLTPGQLEDLVEAFERLVLIHALWARLDPAHRLPAARESTLNAIVLMYFGAIKSAQAANLLTALLELMPDAVHLHALYAQTGGDLDHDERVLRRGLALADAAQDHAARQEIVARLAGRLERAADAGGAGAQAARAELEALVEDTVARAERGERFADKTALKLLMRVATRATRERRYDDALDALERGLPFDDKPWGTHAVRLEVQLGAFASTGTSRYLAGAVSELEAVEQLARRFDDARGAVANQVLGVVALFTQDGRWADARRVLDGALEVLDGHRGAESSLVRAVVVAGHFADDADGLAAALADLTERLAARREALRAPDTRDDRQLEALQALTREASERLARGQLDAKALAAALEKHPARACLPHRYKVRR